MQREKEILHSGHPACCVDIEKVNHSYHREHKQSPVPILGFVARVTEGDETLDDSPRQKRARCSSGLPGEY